MLMQDVIGCVTVVKTGSTFFILVTAAVPNMQVKDNFSHRGVYGANPKSLN